MRTRGIDRGRIAAPETSVFLNSLTAPRRQLVSAWVADPAGIVQAGSQPWRYGTSIGEREFFQAQRDRDAGTYLSAAFTGRATLISSFALSRRRSSRDGGFDGVIHVALSPDYFAGFFRAVRQRGRGEVPS